MKSWDDNYKRLRAGEIIEEGDEIDACADGWRDDPIWKPATRDIGQPAPDPAYPAHRIYRRRKTNCSRNINTLLCPICGTVCKTPCHHCDFQEFDCWGCGAEFPGPKHFESEDMVKLLDLLESIRSTFLRADPVASSYPVLSLERAAIRKQLRVFLEDALGLSKEVVSQWLNKQ